MTTVNKKNEQKKMTVAERINLIRAQSGLSNAELIEISGLSHGWWQRIKNGEVPPSGQAIDRLSERMFVEKAWITGDSDQEPDWKTFRVAMDTVKRKYRNVVREVRARYGGFSKTAAIMTDGKIPFMAGPTVRDAISNFAAAVGVTEDVVIEFLPVILNRSRETEAEKGGRE